VQALEQAVAKLQESSGRTSTYGSHIVSGYLFLARARLLRHELTEAASAIAEAQAAMGQLDGSSGDLDMRVKLEDALVAASQGSPPPGETLDGIEEYADQNSRFDLRACAQLVRALGDPEGSERYVYGARRYAAEWNRYLIRDIEQVWESRSTSAVATVEAGV
jgi:hypothetical protein